MIMMPYGWPWPIAAAHRPGRLLAPHRPGSGASPRPRSAQRCTTGSWPCAILAWWPLPPGPPAWSWIC